MKNYSKSAKRRVKKQLAGMELAETPKRQPNGQKRRRSDAPNDPTKVVLQARVRHLGGKDTKEGRRDADRTHLSTKIGLVMQYECGQDEVRKLWQVFTGWCAAEDTYRRRYLGASENAKGAAIQMVPDRMETDTGHTVDLRSGEERDRDAVTNWMRWQGHLGALSAAQSTALHDARLERVELWREQAPTHRGMQSLQALRALRKEVET